MTTANELLGYDVERVRRDFPALAQTVRGRPLVYLDSAASAHTPEPVLAAMMGFYREDRANVHRGVHTLSQRATTAFEAAREKVRAFLGAASTRETIFVRGTTEAVNLVAQSWGRANVGPGDEILVSHLEHHSNIVPWQLLCAATGARLQVIPIDDSGELRFEEYERLVGPRTKLVAVTHVSNALGTVNPVRELVEVAHRHGALVLVDGAQAAPHLAIDVQALGCDFYAFSGHKLYGPTGIGVLWGRERLLDAMPPWQGGGDMIRTVSFAGSTYADLPAKFEAGTPAIAEAIGLGAAIDYVTAIGFEGLATHEHTVLRYATERLAEIPGLSLVGTARWKTGVLSFTLAGVHPHDVGTILDHEGVAIRTGHHCAQPLMERLGVPATARASLGLYNTTGDVDALVAGIRKVQSFFA